MTREDSAVSGNTSVSAPAGNTGLSQGVGFVRSLNGCISRYLEEGSRLTCFDVLCLTDCISYKAEIYREESMKVSDVSR